LEEAEGKPKEEDQRSVKNVPGSNSKPADGKTKGERCFGEVDENRALKVIKCSNELNFEKKPRDEGCDAHI
jgi:hypothetical protein